MTQHTLLNGQSASVASGQWGGDTLSFAGSSAAAGQTPTVTFTGQNTLANITDGSATSAPGYGAINLMPSGALTSSNLTVNNAALSINERPNAGVTFNGISQISNASTLTATGYAGASNYDLNGTMNIDGTSTVNMDYVAVAGTGTFHLTGPDALLRLGNLGASNTVVLDGGMLSLTNGMTFLGTIEDSTPTSSQISPTASVDVYNVVGAIRETFDLTTGVLSLFNAQGGTVTSLKFGGKGELWAAPTTGLATNYIAITSHSSTGALPVTLTN